MSLRSRYLLVNTNILNMLVFGLKRSVSVHDDDGMMILLVILVVKMVNGKMSARS